MAKKMPLDAFCSYIAQQRRAIQQVYTEVEQVQYQFNDIHQRNMQVWQATLNKAIPLLANTPALPADVARDLLEMVGQERARIEKEIAELTAQVREQRARADSALAEAQKELLALRQVNPQLDADEEQTKAQIAQLRQAIADLDRQMRTTSRIFGFSQRRQLGRERKQQLLALQAAQQRLQSLRQAWVEQKQRYQANQTNLHQQWEEATVAAARDQARLDYLQTNLETLSLQQGSGRYLANLQQPPRAEGSLGTALAEMVERNRIKAAYEEGLRAVAEALGLLKGLAEGMERFLKSAEKVLEEQRRYNLRRLSVRLDDEVLAFHALWPEFAAQVQDEKEMGTHPLEFARRVHTIIAERLSDTAITEMFERMGSALTEATKAWG